MSQLKVNAISDTAGANGNAITLATDGTCTANITNKPGRNLVSNGAFRIAQRSTSSTAQGLKTVDRWQYGGGGLDENPTQAQHALTSSDTGPWAKGFRYSYHLTNGNQTGGAGAADYIDMATRIEAQDIANSGWDYTSASSYITLSFWVRSSVAQNFYGFLKTADGTSQSYPFETGSLSANTWAKVTKKIPGNSNITVNNDNGEGLRITFTPFYGTDLTASSATLNTWAAFSGSAHTPDQTSTWYTTNDATFEITGVQLEVSDYPAEFEHLSYGEELRRCQRYFWMAADGSRATNEHIGLFAAYAAADIRAGFQHPVQMRATPSKYEVVGAQGSNYWRCYAGGDGVFYPDFLDSIKATNTAAAVTFSDDVSTTAGKVGFWRCNDAAARLGFDAEL